MKEEWKTVVIDGKENPWYSVSNLGNVRSHLQNKPLGGYGFGRSYNPNFCKDLSLFKRKRKDGFIHKMEVSLQFPEDFFEEYQYSKKRHSDSNVLRNLSVHQLVMGAFRPMDDYPPDRLKDCWNVIPEDAKTWIKECVYINHIDHDPSNNHVDNLEYVTPRENTRAAVKHYGGHVANKGKGDKWLKVIEPVFNPLFQEWEDGEIQFIGQEGEKYYNMFEDLAKERGKSLSEVYFESIGEQLDKMKEESNLPIH